MKLNFKKMGIEAEADIEKIIEKTIDNQEKDWQLKHNAKKEILELKHKFKMEKLESKNKSSEEIELKKDKLKLEQEKLKLKITESKSKTIIKIISIIMFFIYGLFCILEFKTTHILPAIISLIQMVLVTISILSSTNVLSLFKNDYKILLTISLLLIIPFLAFAI